MTKIGPVDGLTADSAMLIVINSMFSGTWYCATCTPVGKNELMVFPSVLNPKLAILIDVLSTKSGLLGGAGGGGGTEVNGDLYGRLR